MTITNRLKPSIVPYIFQLRLVRKEQQLMIKNFSNSIAMHVQTIPRTQFEYVALIETVQTLIFALFVSIEEQNLLNIKFGTITE